MRRVVSAAMTRSVGETGGAGARPSIVSAPPSVRPCQGSAPRCSASAARRGGEPALLPGPFGGPAPNRLGIGTALTPDAAQRGEIIETAAPFRPKESRQKSLRFRREAGALAAGRNGNQEIATPQRRRRMEVRQRLVVLDMHKCAGSAGALRKFLSRQRLRLGDEDDACPGQLFAAGQAADQTVACGAGQRRTRSIGIDREIASTRLVEPGQAALGGTPVPNERKLHLRDVDGDRQHVFPTPCVVINLIPAIYVVKGGCITNFMCYLAPGDIAGRPGIGYEESRQWRGDDGVGSRPIPEIRRPKAASRL